MPKAQAKPASGRISPMNRAPLKWSGSPGSRSAKVPNGNASLIHPALWYRQNSASGTKPIARNLSILFDFSRSRRKNLARCDLDAGRMALSGFESAAWPWWQESCREMNSTARHRRMMKNGSGGKVLDGLTLLWERVGFDAHRSFALKKALFCHLYSGLGCWYAGSDEEVASAEPGTPARMLRRT
jgi:hypothetical protein